MVQGDWYALNTNVLTCAELCMFMDSIHNCHRKVFKTTFKFLLQSFDHSHVADMVAN